MLNNKIKTRNSTQLRIIQNQLKYPPESGKSKSTHKFSPPMYKNIKIQFLKNLKFENQINQNQVLIHGLI